MMNGSLCTVPREKLIAEAEKQPGASEEPRGEQRLMWRERRRRRGRDDLEACILGLMKRRRKKGSGGAGRRKTEISRM